MVVGSPKNRGVLTEQFGRLLLVSAQCWLLLISKEFFAFVLVQDTVVIVHGVLGGAFFSDGVVVDDIVVGLLQNLPRMGHWL